MFEQKKKTFTKSYQQDIRCKSVLNRSQSISLKENRCISHSCINCDSVKSALLYLFIILTNLLNKYFSEFLLFCQFSINGVKQCLGYFYYLFLFFFLNLNYRSKGNYLFICYWCHEMRIGLQVRWNLNSAPVHIISPHPSNCHSGNVHTMQCDNI